MKARNSARVLAMVGLGLSAFPAWAEEAVAVPGGGIPSSLAGNRLRIVTTTGAWFEGRLANAGDGSLTLVDERGVSLSLEPSQVSRLEVGQRRGRAAAAVRGALIGAGVMAVLGATVYLMDRSEQREDGLCGDISTGMRPCTKKGEIPGAMLGGAMIGAAWGAGRPGITWKPMRTDAIRLAVSPVPGGGVGARATISF